MPLPEPKLDDRHFQDIVNEAKSLIPHYTSEWTDHNLSDPGVTLIELFAWMTDMTLYRLNRVPEKNYIRFMDLLGIRLHGASPAQVPVTFWLSAPQTGPVTISKGTEVATVRTGDQVAISFTTDSDLTLNPPTLRYCFTSPDGQNYTDQTPRLDLAGEFFEAFQHRPQPGDGLYFGFAEDLSQHTLSLNISCQVQGIGVDPHNPPLAWQAWCGDENQWVRADIEVDNTGGFNQSGTTILYLPAGIRMSPLGKQNAYWVRVVMVPAHPQQPTYSASPRINSVKATTVGGTTGATHATVMQNEILGRSDGTAGQAFRLQNTPVLSRKEGETLEVQNRDGDWIPWKEVDSFANSQENDLNYILDENIGLIQLGPVLRQRDGSEKFYGAIPEKSQTVRFSRYRFGGGVVGNVGANTLTVLKTSIPYIARVTNRFPASGGLDAETLDAAKMRAPQVLRNRNRAVTAEDFEYLAREASRGVGRARCIQAKTGKDGDASVPGTVEVLIVPAFPPGERLTQKNLTPQPELIDTVRKYLDERRLLTTNLIVDSPVYVGVSVEATVVSQRYASPERLKNQINERLFRYVDPLTGGPEGNGWPFGRDLYLSEVLTIMQSVSGVEFVQDATLYQIDIQSGQAKAAGQKISLTQDALLFSYNHRITVKGQD